MVSKFVKHVKRVKAVPEPWQTQDKSYVFHFNTNFKLHITSCDNIFFSKTLATRVQLSPVDSQRNKESETIKIEFHPSIAKIFNRWNLQRLCMISRLSSSRLAIKASSSNLLRMKEEIIKVKLVLIVTVLLSIACKRRKLSSL